MHHRTIACGPQPGLQTTHVAVSQSQTPRRFHLLQMALLDFV